RSPSCGVVEPPRRFSHLALGVRSFVSDPVYEEVYSLPGRPPAEVVVERKDGAREAAIPQLQLPVEGPALAPERRALESHAVRVDVPAYGAIRKHLPAAHLHPC